MVEARDVRRWGARLLSALALVSTTLAPRVAGADINARRVVPLLRQGLRFPALVDDDGKLPLLVRFPQGVSAADRDLLEVAPGLGTIRLTPAAAEAYLESYPDVAISVAPPRQALIAESNKWHRASELRERTGLSGRGVVIGVVDTGIDTCHRDFRNADGTTRIAWLMNRAAPRGVHAELEARYGCSSPDQSTCAIFGQADLDVLIDALNMNCPDSAPRDEDGHGTHITGIAAGNGGISLAGKAIHIGVAPEATIIVAAPSGGRGFADPDIVRGAQFAFEQAEAMGMPAVVNVSLGSDFGPHDGSSELEMGLASLVGDDKPGRVLVVAAGNSGSLYMLGDDRGPFGIHTEGHVSPNAVTRVPITQPGASGQIEGSGFVWITFRPGDDVSVGLEGPGGISIGLTGPGEEAGHNGDGVSAGVVNNLVNGKTSLNPRTNGAIVFWDGTWETGDFVVELSGRGDAQLWVTGTGGAGPGRTLGLSFAKALKTGTIGVPASHPELIAVGCTLNRVTWRPFGGGTIDLPDFGGVSPPVLDSTCYFSAAGPTATGVMKPELLAPGGYVGSSMSRDADPRGNAASMFFQPGCGDAVTCLMVSKYHAMSSGTSMSSPQVAGAAALLLERDPTLTQREVRDILQAGAHYPFGLVPYDFQAGPGELDLMGALAVLENKLDGAAVDPASSYYVLGSSYLRPDPSWPVEATIQLRHADRTIATNAQAGLLEVELDGGILLRPVERVRAGLFRFAISAPRGTGGTSVTLDVSYDRQSLGRRVLPVGVDAWAVGAGVDAVGGCALHAPLSRTACGARGGRGRAANVRGAWWLVLAGLVFAIRGRARGNSCRCNRSRPRTCT